MGEGCMSIRRAIWRYVWVSCLFLFFGTTNKLRLLLTYPKSLGREIPLLLLFTWLYYTLHEIETNYL